MTARRTSALVLGALSALAVAGCGSSSPSASPSSSSAAAKVSTPAIATAGKIVWCSDISAPPMEFYDAAKKEQGVDVEIGNEIAERLGVESVWRNTKFSSIIPTLVAGQCDAIQSELYIKPEREEVVDFVPYLKSGQSILTTVANPQQITGLDDSLCGKRASTTVSTTAFALLQAQSDKCVSAGRPEITINRFQDDVSALQQLALDRSDAYATTSETAAYYMTQQQGTYAFSGGNYETVTAGIAVKKGNTALHEAITTAFAEMRQDGTYDAVLAKFHLELDKLS